MTSRAGLVALVGVATLTAACGGSPPTTPPPAAAPKPVAAVPKPVAPAPGVARAVPAAPTTPAAPGSKPPAAGSLVGQTAATAKAAAEVLSASGPHYQIRGRRDPFENLEVTAKERETAPAASLVGSSKVTGIIHGPTSLVLLETAQGMGYIMKVGDTLGEGRLIEIGAEEVVFSVPPKPGSAANRVVLKIAKD